MIDPDRLMEVFEKHGETVTLSLLCDLMPVIGVRMTTAPIEARSDETVKQGSARQGESGK